ncbi:MAG TPA: caspase family protein [Noviherbaspirillum sp.]|jgi:hypothetical protein|uniref:caspase family protein n=1 Tax=Noviherbaspirillum sp. TaxID=1926288 RepID=UPI002F94AAD1
MKMLSTAGVRLALVAALFLPALPALAQRAEPIDRVSQQELAEIRDAFQGIGLRQADVALAEDGRIMLTGEYENRDEVETAFAAARAVVGLSRVAPTTPTAIRYRLKGFSGAFSSTVAKMMQKPASAQPAPAAAIPAVAMPVAAALQSPARGARTLALVVGASTYKYLPPEHGLEGADKDATDIYKFMTSPEGGKIPPEAVKLLRHDQATSVAVKAAMREIMEQTQQGDTVVLFVAAHGLPNAMNKFDIVLYDTEFPRQKVNAKGQSFEFVITNRKTALSDDDLQGFVAQLTAKNVRSVVLLDTCYSGKTFVAIPGYLPSRTRSLKQHKKEVEYAASPSQEAITDLAQKARDAKTSRIVIVSASENEESLESPELGGGAFTQTYIRSLRDARDFANAFDQTKPSVIRIARTLGHSQTPRMLVVPEVADTRM